PLVLGDRSRPPDLDVPLGVRPVEHAEARAGVPLQVEDLAPARLGGDDHVVAVGAQPDDRGLGAAVGVEGGEDAEVGGAEEAPGGVAEAHDQEHRTGDNGGMTSAPDDLTLWYEEPAADWETQALPIGNGPLGAMVFGGVRSERIQFNEKTLWTGGPGHDGYDFGNWAAPRPGAVEEVRRRIDREGRVPAAEVAAALGQPKTGVGAYQTFGDLHLDVGEHGEPQGYRRAPRRGAAADRPGGEGPGRGGGGGAGAAQDRVRRVPDLRRPAPGLLRARRAGGVPAGAAAGGGGGAGPLHRRRCRLQPRVLRRQPRERDRGQAHRRPGRGGVVHAAPHLAA